MTTNNSRVTWTFYKNHYVIQVDHKFYASADNHQELLEEIANAEADLEKEELK